MIWGTAQNNHTNSKLKILLNERGNPLIINYILCTAVPQIFKEEEMEFGFYNMDCMDGMKQFPDKYFDLAIVDPPYGDGNGGGYNRFGGIFDRYKKDVEDGRYLGEKVRKKIIAWDTPPSQEYFNELFRVSRNQIIWGGNYFNLPSTRCFLIWRKTNIPLQGFTMACCEYAWTSFTSNARMFEHTAQRDNTSGKFHPTEKPIDLYKWILTNYAKEGDKILDTHVGSASSLIACEDMGFKYVGFELDQDYYAKAKERIDRHNSQIRFSVDDWKLP